jgi:hypothetical protein
MADRDDRDQGIIDEFRASAGVVGRRFETGTKRRIRAVVLERVG